MAFILDGAATAAAIRSELKEKIAALDEKPSLAVILAGDDPASRIYVKNKEKASAEVGINSVVKILDASATESEILKLVDGFNKDDSITGILVQLPLPCGIDPQKVINAIDPNKDVDGFHPVNAGLLSIGKPAFISCTPKGIMRLLKTYNIDTAGKNSVVIGRSNIVGKPVSLLLLHADATVTICHSKTKHLPQIAKQADILVAAVGKPLFVDKTFVKEGAAVIDVGMNRLNGKLCGDVNFDEVLPLASAISPVPKGIGPMTIAMLLENTYEAHVSRRTFRVSP